METTQTATNDMPPPPAAPEVDADSLAGMTASQRATVGARMMPAIRAEQEAHRKRGERVTPLTTAASLVGCDTTLISRAAQLRSRSPALFACVERGEMGVAQALERAKGNRSAPPIMRVEKRKAQIAELATEGHRIEVICERLQLARSYVMQLASEAKIEIVGTTVVSRSKRISQIVGLTQQGYDATEIAERLQLSRDYVLGLASEEKLVLRGKPPSAPRSERFQRIAELAASGHRASQIGEILGLSPGRVLQLARFGGIKLPDDTIGHRQSRISARRVIEQSMSTLEGIDLALRAAGHDYSEVTPEDAREWFQSLNRSLVSIMRLRRALKETADAKQ
jgi:DNA-binding CsgD family transcriptional regulator